VDDPGHAVELACHIAFPQSRQRVGQRGAFILRHVAAIQDFQQIISVEGAFGSGIGGAQLDGPILRHHKALAEMIVKRDGRGVGVGLGSDGENDAEITDAADAYAVQRHREKPVVSQSLHGGKGGVRAGTGYEP